MRCCLLSMTLLLACGPLGGQSMECAKWVACSDALPGATRGSQDEHFGPSGLCWQGSASSAMQCTQSCKEALAQRASQPGAPVECK